MRFSIIVPIYNVEPFLKECIESVVSQDFSDYELILVNDGSTDNSQTICESYVRKYNFISIISKENGGLTSARKAGTEISKGEYIICLDGDDLLAPGCLKYCSQLIDEFEPDCICFSYKAFREDGSYEYYLNVIDDGLFSSPKLQQVKNNFLYNSNLQGNNEGEVFYSIWSKVTKRDIYCLCQMEIPNEVSLGEDVVLTTKIINRVKSVYFTKFVFYQYRLLSSSMSHSFDITTMNRINLVIDELKKELGEDNRVHVFAYRLLIIQIAQASRALCFGYFRKTINLFELNNIDLISDARKAQISKPRVTDLMKKFIFNNRMYFLLFIYYRIIGR